MFLNPNFFLVAKKTTALISGHTWPRKSRLAKIWPSWFPIKFWNFAKNETFCSKSQKWHGPKVGSWRRVKTMCRVFPLAKNMFGPRSKSIPGVRVGLWPSFGHIFMGNAFWKISKIHRKCKISTGFQGAFKNYGKWLAKRPNMIKRQYFWPKHVTLARSWPYTMPKSFLAKIWPLLHTGKLQKIKK